MTVRMQGCRLTEEMLESDSVVHPYLAALAGVNAVVKPRGFVPTHAALDVELRRRSVVVVLEEDRTFRELRGRLRLQLDRV